METTGKDILNQLDNLMEDVFRILKTTGGNSLPNWDNNLGDEAQEGASKDDEASLFLHSSILF